MSIQTALRQWSSSTLHKGHREVGEEAANRIDELERILKKIKDDDIERYMKTGKFGFSDTLREEIQKVLER